MFLPLKVLNKTLLLSVDWNFPAHAVYTDNSSIITYYSLYKLTMGNNIPSELYNRNRELHNSMEPEQDQCNKDRKSSENDGCHYQILESHSLRT